jgi:hypothetical protein
VRKREGAAKIEIFRESQLICSLAPEWYPAFIFEWGSCQTHDLNNAYVSIDLDVLRKDVVPVGDGYLTIDQVLGVLDRLKGRSQIVAADVCGLYRYHEPTVQLVRKIFDELRDCMIQS